jgi:hypothetical protein
MISEIGEIKFIASIWFLWWLGLALILLRDDSDIFVKDLLRLVKHGGWLAFLSFIALIFIIPTSIPFSIAYFINKWIRKH